MSGRCLDHRIRSHRRRPPRHANNRKKADELLQQDIRNAEHCINQMGADLTQEQFDALISFVFNIGARGFNVSTIRKKILKDPNDPSIADEFRRWVYAGNEKMPGLIKRREQEIKLYYS